MTKTYGQGRSASAGRPTPPAIVGLLLGVVIACSSALAGLGLWWLYAVVGPWLRG